jgi:hypothetical protein
MDEEMNIKALRDGRTFVDTDAQVLDLDWHGIHIHVHEEDDEIEIYAYNKQPVKYTVHDNRPSFSYWIGINRTGPTE